MLVKSSNAQITEKLFLLSDFFILKYDTEIILACHFILVALWDHPSLLYNKFQWLKWIERDPKNLGTNSYDGVLPWTNSVISCDGNRRGISTSINICNNSLSLWSTNLKQCRNKLIHDCTYSTYKQKEHNCPLGHGSSVLSLLGDKQANIKIA